MSLSRIYLNDVLVIDDHTHKRKLRYEPDEVFAKLIARDKLVANLFVCHHNKLMWRSCTKCNRCEASARSWKRILLPKVVALFAKARSSEAES